VDTRPVRRVDDHGMEASAVLGIRDIEVCARGIEDINHRRPAQHRRIPDGCQAAQIDIGAESVWIHCGQGADGLTNESAPIILDGL
jgi:hypothetical protein